MTAVDTNVLVRWITRDDPGQAAAADRLMAERVFISISVLVELAWVLGGKTYGYDRATLAMTLLTVLDLDTVAVPAEDLVRWAITRFAAGADIADMLQIVAARGQDRFATFEKRLARHAGPDTPIPIATLS